eukprot:scaffold19347_cov57-Phaeocystis_antarctica.AAC.1
MIRRAGQPTHGAGAVAAAHLADRATAAYLTRQRAYRSALRDRGSAPAVLRHRRRASLSELTLGPAGVALEHRGGRHELDINGARLLPRHVCAVLARWPLAAEARQGVRRRGPNGFGPVEQIAELSPRHLMCEQQPWQHVGYAPLPAVVPGHVTAKGDVVKLR